MGWLKDLQGYEVGCALKFDMNKAYDQVEWAFLKGVLTKLSLCEKWIRWIMEYVTTVELMSW